MGAVVLGKQLEGGNSGGQKWRGLQPLRNSTHTISLQNSLSWNRAERLQEHLMPMGTTCLSRFWGRKVKWVRRNIGQAKNRIKNTDRKNIWATNFVWEQLKIGKTVKINCRMWTKKPIVRKRNFCSNAVFLLYFRMEKFHAAKSLAFSLHFLLRHDQHHYSNLTANIMKMCEQILRKTAGRIPETARSRNQFKRHPTTHQTKRASTNYDYLETKP